MLRFFHVSTSRVAAEGVSVSRIQVLDIFSTWLVFGKCMGY